MPELQLNILQDALYNLAPGSAKTRHFCWGIVIGVVATLMMYGYDFNGAIEFVIQNSPRDTPVENWPPAWLEDFEILKK